MQYIQTNNKISQDCETGKSWEKVFKKGKKKIEKKFEKNRKKLKKS